MRYLPKILLAASFLAGIPAQAVTEITYWLWDNNQLPAYQACAAAFEKQNPDRHQSQNCSDWLVRLLDCVKYRICFRYGA